MGWRPDGTRGGVGANPLRGRRSVRASLLEGLSQPRGGGGSKPPVAGQKGPVAKPAWLSPLSLQNVCSQQFHLPSLPGLRFPSPTCDQVTQGARVGDEA